MFIPPVMVSYPSILPEKFKITLNLTEDLKYGMNLKLL